MYRKSVYLEEWNQTTIVLAAIGAGAMTCLAAITGATGATGTSFWTTALNPLIGSE